MYSSYASVVKEANLDKLEFFYLAFGFFVPIVLALMYSWHNIDLFFWMITALMSISVGSMPIVLTLSLP